MTTTGPVPARKVLLVGMMGAGKTSVGESLAARLAWPYLDNDAVLLRTTGMTAAQLAATQGEPAVRAAESQVLTLLLAMPSPLIASVPHQRRVRRPARRDPRRRACPSRPPNRPSPAWE